MSLGGHHHMQVPDRGHVQQLAVEAARACERAIAGLPDEWAFHMYLGKMRAKAGAPTRSAEHLQWSWIVCCCNRKGVLI